MAERESEHGMLSGDNPPGSKWKAGQTPTTPLTADTDPVHGYVPTREEMIQLLKHWTEHALDADFFIYWGGCFGRSHLYDRDHAWFKVNQIADMLGDDGEAAVRQVTGEFARRVGKTTWDMFRSGNDDLRDIVQGEAQPQIRGQLGPYAQDYFRRTRQLELADQIEAVLELRAMTIGDLECELGRPASTISEILANQPERFLSLRDGKWGLNVRHHDEPPPGPETDDEDLPFS